MNETAQSYLDWKNEHDNGYVYDEIFDFCAGLSRGEMCEVMDSYLAAQQNTKVAEQTPTNNCIMQILKGAKENELNVLPWECTSDTVKRYQDMLNEIYDIVVQNQHNA
jgi:hypothetical protein